MTHGVTENTAGLTYSGESGGLNEATSDIFGTMVEFYANNADDPGDYLIGEKIDINGNGTPLRYMDKPSKDGALARTAGTPRVGSLDVALLLGPANHFFYLLAEGRGAKTINGVSYNSPTCNGSTGHRHRPRRGREDLVPRADDLHDLDHQLRGGPHRCDRGGQGPVRRDAAPSTPRSQNAFTAIAVPAGAQTCTN